MELRRNERKRAMKGRGEKIAERRKKKEERRKKKEERSNESMKEWKKNGKEDVREERNKAKMLPI